jgi:small-conductance mechanosensitive channel
MSVPPQSGRSFAPAAALVAALLLAALCWPAAAQAPLIPPEAAAPAPASDAKALIEVLKDDVARARLIAGLEAAAAADTSDAPRPLIADRLTDRAAELLRGLDRTVAEDRDAIRATIRRLGGLARIDQAAVARLLPGVALVAGASLAAALAGWLAVRPIRRRIVAAATEGTLTRRISLAIAAALLDAAVVFAAAVAATAAGNAASSALDRYQIAWVAAFLVCGWLLVAVRAVFGPDAPALRPLPMGSRTARSWTRHLAAVIALVVFGEVFLAPLLTAIASPITARASLVALYLLAIAYLIVLVIRKRDAPAAYFRQRAAEREDDIGLMLLAAVVPYWPLLAVPYLVFLAHHAMTTSAAALPVLIGTARFAVAFGLTLLAVGLFNRLADRGIRLSAGMRRAFPTLEERLNAFAPSFLRMLRYVVLAIWLGYALQALGLLPSKQWFERTLGFDPVPAIASLILIVIIGYAAWLLLASWIDYRLAPHRDRMPTARQRTLLGLVRNAGLIAILVLGLTYGLSEVGVSVAPLLASAGVVGLAIGFGSQKLVQDIINGLFIQFENAINVGDVVEVAGKIGSVEKLTIRSVSLRDVEGVFHIVPFSSVDLVSNYMKGFSFHVADISIAYGEDIDAAKAAILAAYDDLKADMTWETKLVGGIEWFGVQALSGSATVLRARLKTRPGEQWAVGRAYTEIVKKRLDAAGIEIPLPQQAVWFGTRPDGAGAPARPPQERAPAASRQTVDMASPTDADDPQDRT